jgi:hypothetical protein
MTRPSLTKQIHEIMVDPPASIRPGLFALLNLKKETMIPGSLAQHIGMVQGPVNLPSRGKLPENLLEFG